MSSLVVGLRQPTGHWFSCKMAVCHWSPLVARTNEDQHKNAIKPELLSLIRGRKSFKAVSQSLLRHICSMPRHSEGAGGRSKPGCGAKRMMSLRGGGSVFARLSLKDKWGKEEEAQPSGVFPTTRLTRNSNHHHPRSSLARSPSHFSESTMTRLHWNQISLWDYPLLYKFCSIWSVAGFWYFGGAPVLWTLLLSLLRRVTKHYGWMTRIFQRLSSTSP